MNKKLTILLTILFIGFVGLGISDIRGNQVKLQVKEIKLHDTTLELNELKLKKEKLNQDFEKATQEKDINEDKVKQLEKEKLELEERYRQLEVSKAEERKKLASANTPSVAGATTITGNKETWLRASGIPETEWWAVDSIVSGESGWNPTARNKSSGACGLGQQLPCGKWGGDWTDPVHALKSMNTYVQGYGGWAAAVKFRNCTGYCFSPRTNSTVYKDHTWY